jgi:hypothetical protein
MRSPLPSACWPSVTMLVFHLDHDDRPAAGDQTRNDDGQFPAIPFGGVAEVFRVVRPAAPRTDLVHEPLGQSAVTPLAVDEKAKPHE